MVLAGVVAAVAEWYRHRIVAGFVTSSSPVPLKTRRVGQRCTLNLSRAETSSRWCGVVVRRGGASSDDDDVGRLTSHCSATRGLLVTDHVILNQGQVTWTTPDLAPFNTLKRDVFPLGFCLNGSFLLGTIHGSLLGCDSPVVKILDHGKHVMSSRPLPLKSRRAGQRCTLNLSRAETSSRWHGVVVRRGECQISDEAHFWLNGYVNKQNCRISSEANPQVYVETPLHPEKLTVWCALWTGGIIRPYFFKNDEGHNVTVNGDRYRAMITNFFIPELNNHDVQELWFQQNGATCHTARAKID
ncbi:uncharacterized protein TNCV_4726081 [Trichonephila clavipes]|nr:uncharacterized protein TNCV_4726081 [Trichonephila clavipes]